MKSPVSCKVCANKSCMVQRFGTMRMKSQMDLKKSQSWYKKGRYIITEGSPVTGIYFIYKGKVKIVTEGINGKEQIVRLANDGHILGHRGYGDEIFPIGAVAMEETVVCFIDNETLENTFMEYPQFTIGLMMFYSQELRRTEKRIKYISQMTVHEKVAEALLYLVEIFGIQENTKAMNADLSRGEISELAGTNADQVSRVISDLKQEEVLSTEGRTLLILDYDKLKKVIGDYDMYFS